MFLYQKERFVRQFKKVAISKNDALSMNYGLTKFSVKYQGAAPVKYSAVYSVYKHLLLYGPFSGTLLYRFTHSRDARRAYRKTTWP